MNRSHTHTKLRTQPGSRVKRSNIQNSTIAVTSKTVDYYNTYVNLNYVFTCRTTGAMTGIVYEVKCIGEGHPVLFREQSYVLKAPFNYGFTTTNILSAFENEYIVASTLEPHPNINRYFCHFTDRIPQEYYNHLPPAAKELAFDPVQNRMHACVWVVLEHHSETLEQFLAHINTITSPNKLSPQTTTPWPIVHKYSRDICAALVHLFMNQTIHFDIKLDNIVVSSNKEQVILIDLGCATKFPRANSKRRQFEIKTQSVISATGNQSHRAPEIINGIARYRQNPDHSSTLCCDKQPSFELGCILFELAMCGKHPLPGYPGGYGPSGKVTFSFESEELFPMKPPQFPKEFCDIVHSLLQCDPENRMPLLEAFDVLLNIESPSPSELLSFYSWVVPLTDDAGTLTSKATCQILCGSPTEDCVDTLHKALDVDPLFSPALLLLHHLSSSCDQPKKTDSRHQQAAVEASLRGKTASFTATDVELTRAVINKKHRNTLPELVLTAVWTRHISLDSESFHNATLLLLKKYPTTTARARAIQQQEQHHQPVANLSIFLRSVINTRNKMMLEALFELQVGNIDSALALVANAFSLFESEMISATAAGDSMPQQRMDRPCVNSIIEIQHSTSISIIRNNRFSRTVVVLHVLCCTVGPIRWGSVTSLGICHEFGVGGVEKDTHKAVTLYQRAADAGDAMAMCILGLCYDNGDGVEKDIHKAVTLYQRAADAGNARAMFNLGVCYQNGDGVAKDIHKAATLWQRAADAGNATAMFNLGVCYQNGDGVEKDIHKAVTLWQRAADPGDAQAMCNLGVCYQNGDGVEKDIHKALTLYQRAADAGNAMAMFNLGLCFKNGDGVEKDIHKAVTLYQRAADAGHTTAMCTLGVRYQNGDGVAKDIHKAVTLWQRAVDAGNARAMNHVAWHYYNGTDGVDQDVDKAVGLWRRAAALGHPGATATLKDLRL
ncbi:sel1 repeat family protein [Pelomyxa schiedti]|nr:sel1 repeat family protein [Pelomyxa schiedti]